MWKVILKVTLKRGLRLWVTLKVFVSNSARVTSGDVCQHGYCHLSGPRVLRNFAHPPAPFQSAIAAMSAASAAADVMASSRGRLTEEVEIARVTLVRNMEAHSDEVLSSTLTSFATVEVDNTPLSTRRQKMDQAMDKLMSGGARSRPRMSHR